MKASQLLRVYDLGSFRHDNGSAINASHAFRDPNSIPHLNTEQVDWTASDEQMHTEVMNKQHFPIIFRIPYKYLMGTQFLS